MQTIYRHPVIAYSGTVSGLRISGVDGTAFVDNLPQAVLDLIALYPGALRFEAYSTNGAGIWGVLKAAGSGETSTEINSNPTFTSNVTGWSSRGSATIAWDANPALLLTITGSAGGVGPSSPASGMMGKLCKQNFSWIAGTYNSTMDWFWESNANLPFDVSSDGSYASPYHTYTADTQYDTSCARRTATTGTTKYTNISLLQFTAPSTSGATIVSAKAGATYNFAYKNASFTYNAASYTVIVRALR